MVLGLTGARRADRMLAAGRCVAEGATAARTPLRQRARVVQRWRRPARARLGAQQAGKRTWQLAAQLLEQRIVELLGQRATDDLQMFERTRRRDLARGGTPGSCELRGQRHVDVATADHSDCKLNPGNSAYDGDVYVVVSSAGGGLV